MLWRGCRLIFSGFCRITSGAMEPRVPLLLRKHGRPRSPVNESVSPEPLTPTRRGPIWWQAGVLVVATGIAYFPALKAGFIWDDDSSLTANRLIRSADGLIRFWTTTRQPDYWPMTSTTLWAEWRLWGLNAAGYHATNVALHIAESLVLWAVLRQLLFPAAFLAAFLFAVHPVNVESVAWIAERKNLMGLLFFLLAIFGFIRSGFERPPRSAGSSRPRETVWYGLSLLTFTLGMLSKGSVAALPLVLLGLIAWRRQLTLRDLVRVAPFFLISVVFAAVDVWFQNQHLEAPIRNADFWSRLLGAGAVVWFYLGKALLPANLTFVYPLWQVRPDVLGWWIPLAAAAAFTLLLWHFRGRGSRGALFAWGYFCANLLPVMGFTDVYFMRYSLVADHYQHIAIIGVVAAAAAGWWAWRENAPPSRFRWPELAATAVIFMLICLTWRQCRLYRDNFSLYRATLERNPGCWMARNNLGRIYASQGLIAQGIAQYREALRLKPDFAEAHLNLGDAFAATGRRDEAIGEFQAALRINPRFAVARNDLGKAFADAGRLPEAIDQLGQALQLNSDLPEAHLNAGAIFSRSGRLPEAIGQYDEALDLDPSYPEAHNDLGIALRRAGRTREAILQYEQALRLRPDYPEAENNLGVALAGEGRLREARDHFERALRLQPGYLDAGRNLGLALRRLQTEPPP